MADSQCEKPAQLTITRIQYEACIGALAQGTLNPAKVPHNTSHPSWTARLSRSPHLDQEKVYIQLAKHKKGKIDTALVDVSEKLEVSPGFPRTSGTRVRTLTGLSTCQNT